MDQQRITEVQKSLSRRLAECRESLDVSQEQLASRIGRSVKVIQNIEEGDKEQSVIMLLECARALGITLSELLELAISDHDLIVSAGSQAERPQH